MNNSLSLTLDAFYTETHVTFSEELIEDQFYLMGEAGGAFAVTNKYNEKSLLLSPSIGYVTKNFDFSIRFEHLADFPIIENNTDDTGLNQIALRIAYGFKL